jgi:hypothetical protein
MCVTERLLVSNKLHSLLWYLSCSLIYIYIFTPINIHLSALSLTHTPLSSRLAISALPILVFCASLVALGGASFVYSLVNARPLVDWAQPESLDRLLLGGNWPPSWGSAPSLGGVRDSNPPLLGARTQVKADTYLTYGLSTTNFGAFFSVLRRTEPKAQRA